MDIPVAGVSKFQACIKVIFLPKLQSLEAQNNISFQVFSSISTERTEKGEEGY